MPALNSAVWKEGESSAEYRGMGATVVFTLVARRVPRSFANVGDCRAYLFRDRQAAPAHPTTTPSPSTCSIPGLMSRRRSAHALARQQLLQHMGIPGRADAVDVQGELADADRILMCSDGLTDMLPDDEIAGVLRASPTRPSACTSLVRKANRPAAATTSPWSW